MAAPACRVRHREYRGVRLEWQAQQVVDGRGVVVHVRQEAFLALHHLFHPHRYVVPAAVALELAYLLARVPEYRRTGVAVLVHTVPETHYTRLPGQRVHYPLLGFVYLADLQQHLHDRLVGPAMQRALQRPDRGRDAGVDVRQRGYRYPGRERGSIELVLRVYYQG